MDIDPTADPAFVLNEIAEREEPLGTVAGHEVRLLKCTRLGRWPPELPRLDGEVILVDSSVFVIPREEVALWAGRRLGVQSAREALAIADRLKEMIAEVFEGVMAESQRRLAT